MKSILRASLAAQWTTWAMWLCKNGWESIFPHTLHVCHKCWCWCYHSHDMKSVLYRFSQRFSKEKRLSVMSHGSRCVARSDCVVDFKSMTSLMLTSCVYPSLMLASSVNPPTPQRLETLLRRRDILQIIEPLKHLASISLLSRSHQNPPIKYNNSRLSQSISMPEKFYLCLSQTHFTPKINIFFLPLGSFVVPGAQNFKVVTWCFY